MLTREQSIELLRKMGVEISDSCTEEELNTAIATALAKGGDVTPAPAATKIEGEGAGCSAAMTKALTDAVAAAMAPLSAKLGAIEAKNVSDEKAALINKATQAGKAVTLSADIIAGMSPAALSAVLDQLPAGQVPLEGATRTNPGAAAQGAALSAEDASTVHKLFPGLKALDAKKLGELAELA